MDLFGESIAQAIRMLGSNDPEVWRITLLTLRVSGTATLISVLVGVPLGVFLALLRVSSRGFLVSLINSGMGLPPVVAGLLVSMLLSRYGPLGHLDLIFTPTAMVIAQSVIAVPIVTGFTLAGVQQLNPRLPHQILALGASRPQLYWLLIREARLAVLAAIMAGFGRVVAEVGASMMVGGNIQGQTRVLTTATVMEVNKGEYPIAIALSFILLMLVWLVTYGLTWLQQRGRTS
ncbi:MAG: ABC transporter permease [Bacillota bacterium]